MPDLIPEGGRVHIGVDIGGTKMLVLAYGAGERRSWTFPTGLGADSKVVLGHLQTVLDELACGERALAGIGVPGIVDERGRIQDCDVLPRLRGWAPARDLAIVPPHGVLNDAEAALANLAATNASEATLAVVGCGTGIGFAFQAAGKRLRRYRPYAGELGYAPFGLYGTYDEHASGAALLKRTGLPAEELTERLEQGDEACREAARGAGEALGASLAAVLHILHPEVIGLYGGALRFPGYCEAALHTLDRISHPLLRRTCRVEVLPEPEFAVAHGAMHAALGS